MDVSAVLERVEAPNTIDGADVVPPGFKHTEVGVIPKDWCARRLRDCLRSTPAYGINAPASAYDDRLPTYLWSCPDLMDREQLGDLLGKGPPPLVGRGG